MLNNDKLWDTSQNAAQLLLNYEAGAQNAKKDRANNIQTLLKAANKKSFIDGLLTIVSEASEKQKFEELALAIHLMPSENVPYFLTLIRFHYILQNK